MDKSLERKWVKPPKFDNEDVFGLMGDESVFNYKFLKAFQGYKEKLETKGWKFVGKGRHRSVFKSPAGDRVIKVSHVPMGVKANLFELFYGEKGESFVVQRPGYFSEVHIPKVWGHTRVGQLSILCVEWVERTKGRLAWDLAKEKGGQWIYDVDCDGSPQVGYTKSGRLVAFDWCTF